MRRRLLRNPVSASGNRGSGAASGVGPGKGQQVLSLGNGQAVRRRLGDELVLRRALVSRRSAARRSRELPELLRCDLGDRPFHKGFSLSAARESIGNCRPSSPKEESGGVSPVLLGVNREGGIPVLRFAPSNPAPGGGHRLRRRPSGATRWAHRVSNHHREELQ